MRPIEGTNTVVIYNSASPDNATLTFTAPNVADTLPFQITVTDNDTLTATASVHIIVEVARPSISARPHTQQVIVNNQLQTVTITADASGPVDSYSIKPAAMAGVIV